MSHRPILPPRYVNIPAGLVYDQALSPAVRDTYIQLRGLAWGRSELDSAMSALIELTGKSRATIYGHLAILRDQGWLLFSTARYSGLTVRFLDAARDLSRNLDLLNEEDSVNHDSDLHLPINSLTAHGVQKSGQESRNLDGTSPNGWKGAIDEELEQLLDRVGVFRAKFGEIAAAGWPANALKEPAREVLESMGEGKGGGIYLYRLANRQRPLSAEEREELRRERFRRQAQLYEAGNYEELLR